MSKPASTLVSFHSFVSASVSVSRSLLVFDGGGGGGDRVSVFQIGAGLYAVGRPVQKKERR